jgi:hypothetical protein
MRSVIVSLLLTLRATLRDRAALQLEILAFHQSRTHLSLDKDSPQPRPIAPPTCGPVVASPQVGGLHR